MQSAATTQRVEVVPAHMSKRVAQNCIQLTYQDKAPSSSPSSSLLGRYASIMRACAAYGWLKRAGSLCGLKSCAWSQITLELLPSYRLAVVTVYGNAASLGKFSPTPEKQVLGCARGKAHIILSRGGPCQSNVRGKISCLRQSNADCPYSRWQAVGADTGFASVY